MLIKVSIIDEFNEVEQELGTIEQDDLKLLIKIAEEKDFQCLSFLDITGDTIFNKKQLYQVKKEIGLLNDIHELNQQMINIINLGIDKILSEDYLYLKFEGA